MTRLLLASIVASVGLIIPSVKADYLHGSPGSYTSIGNSTFGPGGSSTRIGNTTFGPNGSSTRIGNTNFKTISVNLLSELKVDEVLNNLKKDLD